MILGSAITAASSMHYVLHCTCPGALPQPTAFLVRPVPHLCVAANTRVEVNISLYLLAIPSPALPSLLGLQCSPLYLRMTASTRLSPSSFSLVNTRSTWLSSVRPPSSQSST